MSKSYQVRVRAPLRLSLAGGGTDVEPFASISGSKILNFAIDTYAEASIESNTSAGKGVEVEVFNVNNLEHKSQFTRTLEQAIRRRMPDKSHWRVQITNPVGSGSGLGTSSAMIIAVRIAIQKAMGLEINEELIISDSFSMERFEMGISGGFQDYFPAIHGGFNWIIQEAGRKNRTRAEVLIGENVQMLLQDQMFCLELGIKRKGEEIIKDQVERAKKQTGQTWEALTTQLSLAEKILESIRNDDVSKLLRFLEESYQMKKQYSPLISNETIDQVERSLIDKGAKGLKISGAGGGGHMYCFFPSGIPGNLQEVLPSHTKRAHFKPSWKGWHFVD